MPIDGSSSMKHHKPRMLYFQARTAGYSPLNYEGTNDRPLKALRELFDVIVVSEDCDFREVCDRYVPDIALFDVGDGAENSRLEIANVAASHGVPKIGFMKGDSWSTSRTRLLYEVEEWDLEVVFEQGDLALKEYLPQIEERLFYWPLFVDTDLYMDFQAFKTIPFLILGQTDVPAYEWRGSIKRAVASAAPSLVFPHPGYQKQFSDSFVIFRDAYARTINSSFFALGGGAWNHQMLKKNLEIPACRACLVTDRTIANELFGFKDMVNCVFATEADVADKISYLASHRNELEEITAAGHALVHDQHSHRHRKQILQWFNLRKQIVPGQRIIQPDLFGDLRIEGEDSKEKSIALSLDAQDRLLLREGDRLLVKGDFESAAALFEAAGEFTGYIPDADIRLALCMLYLGSPPRALELVKKQFELTRRFEVPEPDPVEWASLMLALVCQGELKEALRFSRYFTSLCHPMLDRTRWIVSVLVEDDEMERIWAIRSFSPSGRQSTSIHSLPSSVVENHVANARMMLRACGQSHLASRIPDIEVEEPLTRGVETELAASLEGKKTGMSPVSETSDGIADAIETLQAVIARQTMLRRLKTPLKRVVPRKAGRRFRGALSKLLDRLGIWMMTISRRL